MPARDIHIKRRFTVTLTGFRKSNWETLPNLNTQNVFTREDLKRNMFFMFK